MGLKKDLLRDQYLMEYHINRLDKFISETTDSAYFNLKIGAIKHGNLEISSDVIQTDANFLAIIQQDLKRQLNNINEKLERMKDYVNIVMEFEGSKIPLEVYGKYTEEIKETREMPGERSRFKIIHIKKGDEVVTDILLELFGEDYFEELVLKELEG